jgi:hypothetical protein
MSLPKTIYAYPSWPIFFIKSSNIQYSSGFYFFKFVIDWMSKKLIWDKYDLEKYLWSTRYVQLLPASELIPFLLGCPCSFFSFQCFLFICLSLYFFITQCCFCLWIFHYCLPLMFTYIYIFNVIPYNYLGHNFLWLNYCILLIWTRSHCHAPITESVDRCL